MINKFLKFFLISTLFLLSLSFSKNSFAYPDAETLGPSSTNPPFDFGVTSTLTGFLLTSDRRMVLAYGETLKLVDLGKYALEAVQPPALSNDDDTDGLIGGIAYDDIRNDIVASQQDGDILIFDLDNISATPSSITVVESDKLGPIALDTENNVAYVADNTAKSVQVVNLTEGKLQSTIELSIGTAASFTITDAVYLPVTEEVYFTTSAGSVFYIAIGGTVATRIIVDSTSQANLVAVGAFPGQGDLYVVDSTNDKLVRISTSSHQVTNADIALSYNPSPTDVIVADVLNPGTIYGYAAGQATPNGGVSVINIANDNVIDMGTDATKDHEPIYTSAVPSWLAASSETDGYVYMGFATGKVGIISANPFITISSITYADGGTSLKPGGSATITFQSTQSGTYVLRAGGTQAGTGTTLVDSSGQTSGSVVAATDTAVTINYDDNASAFAEGANDLWAFVTNSPNTGRRAGTITIDTPPPNVTIRSIGFGNSRIYVNFDRIDVSDMSTYRLYVSDISAEDAKNKSDVSATASQASSGSTQTAEVSGLSNGTTYYVAMEAVDAVGNVSPARTNTLADGSTATGMPEVTVGPAGLIGEKGCSLVQGSERSLFGVFMMGFAMVLVTVCRRYYKIPPSPLCQRGSKDSSPLSKRGVRGDFTKLSHQIIIIFFFSLISLNLYAQTNKTNDNAVIEKSVGMIDAKPTPSDQMWQFELKTGFWLPQSAELKYFFTNCCNMITRVSGGLLLHKRYGVEASAGFLYKTAAEIGSTTGRTSQDRFSFILVPTEINFVWRADYFSWRYIVPFVRPGFDLVYFREGDKSAKAVQGVKCGIHAGGGIGINISELGDFSGSMDQDTGINELFLTLEAKYQYINNFGAKGLNLSGGVYSIGMLFVF